MIDIVIVDPSSWHLRDENCFEICKIRWIMILKSIIIVEFRNVFLFVGISISDLILGICIHLLLIKEGNFSPTKDELDHAFLLQLLFWFKQSFRFKPSVLVWQWMNEPMVVPTTKDNIIFISIVCTCSVIFGDKTGTVLSRTIFQIDDASFFMEMFSVSHSGNSWNQQIKNWSLIISELLRQVSFSRQVFESGCQFKEI